MKPIKIADIITAVNGRLLWGDPLQRVASVCTDSREIKKGGLFVPLIGEKTDAHKFIPQVIEKEAACVFSSKIIERENQPEKGACILVEDTLKALQDFAAYYRSLFLLPIIGITGSVGKTTTKEMVSAVLGCKYQVLKTEGNMNSQVGLSLMMFRIEEDTEAAVIEMGISMEGEMERLARIARPQTALVTNIGVSHIGQLKTKENIRKEKLNIINQLKPGDRLYLNGDDPLLCEAGRRDIVLDGKTKEVIDKISIVYYGLNQDNDMRAENIRIQDGNTYFTFVWTGEDGKEMREEITLSVLGTHNIGNALAALSIGLLYGVCPKEAKEGLKALRPIGMRGLVREKNKVKVIDDTYNASPDSMKGAVEVLLSLGGIKRRIAVLADVLELGEISRACHFEVGEYIGRTSQEGYQVDILVTVGEEAKAIMEGAIKENCKLIARTFSDNAGAISYLLKILQPQDGILVKGSRGMRTDEIVDALLADRDLKGSMECYLQM